MATLLDHDPVVADARAFFSLLDWSIVERWEAQQSPRGRPAHPISAFLKAFLIRIRQGCMYTTQLRDFLVKHPLLVIELGFHLVPDPTNPYGFDAERTLPGRFWLGEKLRCLDRGLLQDLLAGTVHALQEEIPGLGEVVSFGAMVLESRLPPRLTMGMSSWPKIPSMRNEGDVTSFRPLYQQTVVPLNQFPTHVTADAASASPSSRFCVAFFSAEARPLGTRLSSGL